MIKKPIFLIAVLISLLQACSVSTDTTYFKDAATSMESNIHIDRSMAGMMSMMEAQGAGPASQFKKLSTDWKSLYDIQKDSYVNLNEDSVKVLKKLFMKVNKDKGQLSGISVKYDKLMPGEITQLLSQSRQLRNMPLQDAGQWDGKTLTLNTEKFRMGDFLSQMDKIPPTTEKPTTKQDSIMAYGKQMASGMIGMLKMVDMKMTSTLKFQKPIKSITGKHDYVKQIDRNTVQISLRSKELLNEERKLKNQDKQIIITTE